MVIFETKMIQERDVMVALKNGQTKYGLLLTREIEIEKEAWSFIDYSNIKQYAKTKNQSLVEILKRTDIKFIDLDLR